MTTTASTPTVRRLWAYRWVLALAVVSLGLTAWALAGGGQLVSFEAGMALTTAYFAWTNTRAARREAREWAALKARNEKGAN